MKFSCFFLAATLFGADPFVGTWRLNVAKSNYAPGQCPKSMTIDMAAAGDAGVSYRSETEFADGRRAKSSYTAEYGGAEVIVMGTNGMQTPVSLKRIDDNTVEAAYSRSMKVLASSRRVVSNGGKTLTVTTVSKDKSGKESTNVGVYDRQ